MMKKRIEDVTISNIQQINDEHIIIEVQSENSLEDIKPGQFVNIEVKGSKTTFLRRPISIHDVDIVNHKMSFFIKLVGDGTKAMSTLKSGELINIIYPLGNQFHYEGNKKPLLIGGGCGLAPLLYLSRKFYEMGVKPDILIGARSSKNIFIIDKYQKFGNVFTITDDGSHGEKGIVTTHSLFEKLSDYDKIFVCGPDVMMIAVGKIAIEHKIDCEVSLENMMACGIGACLCCVTDTKIGHQCVCTEGPVFNVKDLKW